MKSLDGAPTPDFNVYVARPDTRWIEREGEPLHRLYNEGFLPYSGNAGLNDIFYSARSARVVLPELKETSENRRISKRFDGMFERTRLDARTFVPDEAFFNFCLSYFAEKHGADAMPRARLETILRSGLVSDIYIYSAGGKVAAYVLEVAEGQLGHYWFSFYDLAYARQSLGLWLMYDCTRAAKERGLTHYYLGTVYGQKALYKTNFEPLEWWDGTLWQRDIVALKALARGE